MVALVEDTGMVIVIMPVCKNTLTDYVCSQVQFQLDPLRVGPSFIYL